MNYLNNNFDFNKYKAFYTVIKTGSFSKAAKELNVSQPSISYAIKELEKEYNCVLLNRNNRSIELTEKGQKLKCFVENIFNNLEMSYKYLLESSNIINGSIRIGIFSHISTLFIPNLIKEFTKEYPDVDFDIYSSTSNILKEKFKNNELDILILHYPIFLDDDKYNEQVLYEFESTFFCNDKFNKILNNKNNKIEELPLILPTKGYFTSDMLDKIFKYNNIYLKSNIHVYTTELMIEMVKKGLGIGWGIKNNIVDEINEKKLFPVSLNIDLPKIKYSIAYKKNDSLTLNTFIKYIINNKDKIIKK
ncbi:MAG: LysR family transcriptional regulator [Bacilli bacterium]